MFTEWGIAVLEKSVLIIEIFEVNRGLVVIFLNNYNRRNNDF